MEKVTWTIWSKIKAEGVCCTRRSRVDAVDAEEEKMKEEAKEEEEKKMEEDEQCKIVEEEEVCLCANDRSQSPTYEKSITVR